MTARYTVTFLPSGKSAEVEAGTRIWELFPIGVEYMKKKAAAKQSE